MFSLPTICFHKINVQKFAVQYLNDFEIENYRITKRNCDIQFKLALVFAWTAISAMVVYVLLPHVKFYFITFIYNCMMLLKLSRLNKRMQMLMLHTRILFASRPM